MQRRFIWTDVAGIYTTDPRIVPAAQRIDTMSFAEAAEMATFGAKVLHPATLLPAVRSNIPVYVGSSKAPEAGGTWARVIRSLVQLSVQLHYAEIKLYLHFPA